MQCWWDGELVGVGLIVVCVLQGVGVADDVDVSVEGRCAAEFNAIVCGEGVEVVGDVVDSSGGRGRENGPDEVWEREVWRRRWVVKCEGEEVALLVISEG